MGTFRRQLELGERKPNGDIQVDQGQVSWQEVVQGVVPGGTCPPPGQAPCHLGAWLPREETEPGSPEVSRGVAGWWVGFVLEAWVRLF